MSQGKKYDYKISQTAAKSSDDPSNSTWQAEIIRQVTSRRTKVSKSQDGFATEAEATEWGKQALVEFLENQKAKNKRQAKPQKAHKQAE
jgi:hypothetical protein